MTAEFRIQFDGEVPGLDAGRLSLTAFLPALDKLLIAFKRIGSTIITAAENPELGAKGGRVAKPAAALDIELSSIENNCLVIVGKPTTRPIPGEQASLFNDLAEDACNRFLDDIDAERRGIRRSYVVREYLKALPPLRNQKYTFKRPGQKPRVVEFEKIVEFHDDVTVLPTLREFTATPLGAMFDSMASIRLDAPEDGPSWFLANANQVDTVLDHRREKVRVLVLYGAQSMPRILRLRVGDAPLAPASGDAVTRRIFTDWHDALELLA